MRREVEPIYPLLSSRWQAEELARKNDPNRKEVEIDADLRASYYFPTSRKR